MLGVNAVCYALMGAAAAVDARERVFPNALAAAFTLSCALAALDAGGAELLRARALGALACCGALLAFELAWRRAHGGAAGLGMGDLKYLFGALLLDPAGALVSFAAGLAALAVAGLASRRASLPLLPFVVGAQAALIILSGGGSAGAVGL